MDNHMDISNLEWETNSDLWEVDRDSSGKIFRLQGNTMVDVVGGKVLIFKILLGNYRMRAEVCFLGHHLPEGTGGWFGFVMRAKDKDNYELVWFMPFAESGKSAAYLSVAHGIVPWWTEAYNTQEKLGPGFQPGEWFEVEISVVGDEFTLFMKGERIYRKKLTYYLSEGYPGFYVGTATDASFRNLELVEFNQGNQ